MESARDVANNQPPRQEEQSPLRTFFGFAQKFLLIYIVSQFVGQMFNSQQQKPPVPTEVSQQFDGITDPFRLPPVTARLAWPLGTELDMHVYFSTSPFARDVFSDFGKQEAFPNFLWDHIILGDWNDNSRFAQYSIDIPSSVQKNASSLFAHIFLAKDHANPNPSSPQFDPASVHHYRKLLTPYLTKKKVRTEKNLLRSGDPVEEEISTDVILPHWHSNLTLTIVSDNVTVPYQKLPPPASQYITLIPDARDNTGTQGFYPPIIFPNDFWHLRSQMIEINSTTTSVPLRITLDPISYTKFQIYATLTASFEEAAKQGAASAEFDEIKRMLVETNPWFLGLTALVSVLHMVFEILAFSSDVSHWRNKKELTGVSIRTIVVNVIVQLVILLYLVDNNADTSWTIIVTQGMSIGIEGWKITKIVDIRVLPSSAGSMLPYRFDIRDKHVLSEDEKKTQEYDREAYRYVSYVAIPLLAAYTVYSVIYETHRGWYSFTISTLTSFVYTFGFAQMVPQLIINYKLKSVAHLPIKAMIYKTLSTVVDDLFAFCIKMPILHRIACFRDDVVFLIFLYQRWIYRVDPTRVNEFGQVMHPDDIDRKEESKKDK